MTRFKEWCGPATAVPVGPHTIGVLVSINDEVGIGAVAAHLPSRYAETKTLAGIADRLGKTKLSAFLRTKFPTSQKARSGDLGEILATTYLEEECGYATGPSRLVHRDHQEWAMRGDDVLAARFDSDSKVLLVKGEAKSRAKAGAAVVKEARESLQRADGLPSPHSLVQFAERLLHTTEDAMGEAILELQLDHGIRPEIVTHLMFLFAGNNPSKHVKEDLLTYAGEIAQRAVILQVQAHQYFIRMAFERAIADGA